MSFNVAILDREKLTDICNDLLLENGKLKLLSYLEYKNFKWEDFRVFCHESGRYGIPTIELIELLKKEIGDRDALEIGSGNGDLGYHLGIRMTDSKIQESQEVKLLYKQMGQPTIKYPADVEKIEALEAVKKYKPKLVVASWVTVYAPHEMRYGSSPHGIKEDEIIDLVDTYILVGNISSHGDKPIMKRPHRIIEVPFNISRSINRDGNRIWMWDKK